MSRITGLGDRFWIGFLEDYELHMGPKFVHEFNNSGSSFGSRFFEVKGLSWLLLGVLLGFLETSGDASRAKIMRQSFANSTF